MQGKNILKLAAKHIGEEYVLGARAVLDNSKHEGPWDCAEYASWCTYQTYNIVFGTYGKDPKVADPYSGKWFTDGEDAGTLVSVEEALVTPGAFVVRKPGAFDRRIGHVAICLGNGHLYEAKSASEGVVLSKNAYKRNWTTGVQIPGVLYSVGQIKPYSPPANILRITHPFMRGKSVRVLQKVLAEKGFRVKKFDGIFGPDTEATVTNFQLAKGLVVDGEVGPQTAKALGLSWPIS